MMKMKYQEDMQHLSAILTIAMICIQAASSVYGALITTHWMAIIRRANH
jgi:hypothetical protein